MNPFRLSSLFAIVLFCLLCLPLAAQDGTAEPVVTIEAMPVSLVTAEATAPLTPTAAALPVAVDTDGGNVTINTGTTPVTPATATDPSNSVPTSVVIVGAIVAGMVFIALLFNQHLIVKAIAPLMTPETAQAFVDSMLPRAVDIAVNTLTPVIPGTLDDEAFIKAAQLRGLVIARGDDGLYHTTRAPAAPPATPGAAAQSVSATRLLTDPGPDYPPQGTR